MYVRVMLIKKLKRKVNKDNPEVFVARATSGLWWVTAVLC